MTSYSLNEIIKKDIEKYYDIKNLDVDIQLYKLKEIQELITSAKELYLYVLYEYGLVKEFQELPLYLEHLNDINIRQSIDKIRRFRRNQPLKFAKMIEEIPALFTLEYYRILLKYCRVPSSNGNFAHKKIKK